MPLFLQSGMRFDYAIEDLHCILAKEQVEEVSPTPSDKVLYIHQGEIAFVNKHVFDFVGSDDATTCMIVMLIGVNNILLTHIDSEDRMLNLEVMLNQFILCESLSAEFDLYVSGGIDQVSCHNMLLALLSTIDSLAIVTRVRMLKVCKANMFEKEGMFSISSYGLGYARRSNSVVPMYFPDNVRGPWLSLRNAGLWNTMGTSVLRMVHDCRRRTDQHVFIQNFSICIPREWAQSVLSLPEQTLLKQTSTTPLLERKRCKCLHTVSSIQNSLPTLVFSEKRKIYILVTFFIGIF